MAVASQLPLRVRLAACMCQRTRLIGLRGDLPWRLDPDLQYFRSLLAAHRGAGILGRATYDEAIRTHPEGLPLRPIVVLTSRPMVAGDGAANCGVSSAASLGEALAQLQDTAASWASPESGSAVVWVLGGASAYREALPVAASLSLTLITGGFDAAAAGAGPPCARAAYFPEGWEDYFVLDPSAVTPESRFDAASGLTYEFHEYIPRRKAVA
eukprot:CAMPEP_0203900278 /NCGR_PEP_ID=MMETSP0359-20131031/42573_1 /ASSEMBLY_ACC=CAM_ASM_000338 /TAXON_ID=268821 /ORGANISM="Scrippsiella Hangoei, Strain SHTV-5" /LENGTH=211 /DNA_ID=CAMNT_0050823699 /DNA_START=45 /DNA_END=680 /DNA_ORIENTATION=-